MRECSITVLIVIHWQKQHMASPQYRARCQRQLLMHGNRVAISLPQHLTRKVGRRVGKKSNENTSIPIPENMDPRRREAMESESLVDERTGNSYIGIDFPRRQPGRGFEVFDDDLAEQPTKIRTLLKGKGAAFRGTKIQQVRLIQRLLKEIAPKPITLAMKPGLRGPDGFVLGKYMVGTAADKFRWKSPSGAARYSEIGDSQGSSYMGMEVGELASHSTFLTFGLSLSLACPLPSYVLVRSKQRLLSETAVFNLSGDSGSGKTSVVRGAAGVFGPPGLLRKWDFSRRGLEEQMEARNDLLAAFDDTETHTEEATRLPTAIRQYEPNTNLRPVQALVRTR